METRELVSGYGDSIIEKVKDIEDNDVDQPVKKTKGNQVDREKDEFDNGFENGVDKNKDQRSNEVGIEVGFDVEAFDDKVGDIERKGGT